MAASQREQRELHYGGNVQGVGFRFTTQNIASRYEVTGFVRNLPDGRVQLVAEGEASELDRFLEDLAATMADYIRDVQQETRPASGRWSDFSIRH